MNDLEIRQHAAFTRGVGVADLGSRTQVELSGKDRARLLHGLCTNDIKALQPGEGCEAFLTNSQGKTNGYIYVFCETDRLLIETTAGQAQDLIRLLDRYVIREDVAFRDLSVEWCELVLCGPEAPQVLAALHVSVLPAAPLQQALTDWRNQFLRVRKVPFCGSTSYFLTAPREFQGQLHQDLVQAGAVACDAKTVEVARIEAGSPLFGIDLTSECLPQEVQRERAISFTKGCYLGQETVARIDALGHVNRTLCGIRLAGEEIPPPGAEVNLEQKIAARITSSCWSPRLGAPLALGYVRRGLNEIGKRFPTPWGEAEVVRLPLE